MQANNSDRPAKSVRILCGAPLKGYPYALQGHICKRIKLHRDRRSRDKRKNSKITGSGFR